MLLSEIPQYINCKKIYNLKKKKISFVLLSTNSKYIKKKSVLVINKKNNFKKKFINESIKKGAVGIISDSYYKDISVPQFIVNNPSLSLNKLLKTLRKVPPRNIIAVTGTNGKTSVVSNIKNISCLSKRKIKSYGTLGYYKNLIKQEESILTTPEYEILYQKAYSIKNKNDYDFIFEASSHSISKKRITKNSFPINIAALTNISHEHLDFHKTFKNYKKIKFKLFEKYLKDKGIAVLNDNIKGISFLKKKLLKKKIKIISYGTIKSNIYLYKSKNKMKIKVYNKDYSLKFINYNKFELENLSCSIGCSLAMGINLKK